MRVSYCIFLFCFLPVCVAHAGGFVNGVVPFPSVPSNNGGWLKPAAFPTVFDDLSFNERRAVKAKGYEPFKDMEAYRGLVVEGEEHFIERQLALLMAERDADAQTMSREEYCQKYPLDETLCGENSGGISCTVSAGGVSPAICGSVAAPNPWPTTPGTSTPPAGTSTSTPTPATPSSPTNSGNSTFAGKTIGGGTVVVNNRTIGGSCYPAARSSWFGNTILTSGQYEQVSPAFEKALITLFRKEGGCGEIPNDPCGYTCYGLGSGPKCMNMDVSKLTRKDAETVYYNRFWNKYHFEKLPDVISGELFMSAAGAGVCTSIQQFREFLGIKKNCKIDDDLVAAVKNYNGDILNDWLDVRKKFLTEVARRRYGNSVLTGWLNGTEFRRENGCHVVPKEPLYR